MAVNKVVYDDQVLLDVSNDTVTPDTLLAGATAHDASGQAISGAVDLSTKADKSEGTFFIVGTGTTDSTAKTSTWTGTSDRITSYYDGLAIRYKIGVAGQTTTTLNINNLGAKTVYLFNSTKLTTHFSVGSIINLIYNASLNSGCWMCSDYDSNTNTYQRVYPTTTNAEYPITARYNTTAGSSYYAEYGRYSTGVTLNPSTNTITATEFKGKLTGNATSATKATQDGNGKDIAATYVPKDGSKVLSTNDYTNGEKNKIVIDQIGENDVAVLNAYEARLSDGTRLVDGREFDDYVESQSPKAVIENKGFVIVEKASAPNGFTISNGTTDSSALSLSVSEDEYKSSAFSAWQNTEADANGCDFTIWVADPNSANPPVATVIEQTVKSAGNYVLRFNYSQTGTISNTINRVNEVLIYVNGEYKTLITCQSGANSKVISGVPAGATILAYFYCSINGSFTLSNYSAIFKNFCLARETSYSSVANNSKMTPTYSRTVVAANSNTQNLKASYYESLNATLEKFRQAIIALGGTV